MLTNRNYDNGISHKETTLRAALSADAAFNMSSSCRDDAFMCRAPMKEVLILDARFQCKGMMNNSNPK